MTTRQTQKRLKYGWPQMKRKPPTRSSFIGRTFPSKEKQALKCLVLTVSPKHTVLLKSWLLKLLASFKPTSTRYASWLSLKTFTPAKVCLTKKIGIKSGMILRPVSTSIGRKSLPLPPKCLNSMTILNSFNFRIYKRCREDRALDIILMDGKTLK